MSLSSKKYTIDFNDADRIFLQSQYSKIKKTYHLHLLYAVAYNRCKILSDKSDKSDVNFLTLTEKN
jgi:hypothetical protein